MTNTQPSSLIALALNDGLPPSPHFPFWRLLVLSLTLHFAILLVAELVRLLPSHEERIVAHEISLVNLPSAPPPTKKKVVPKKRLPPKKVQPTVQPKVETPPPVKKAPPPPPPKVAPPKVAKPPAPPPAPKAPPVPKAVPAPPPPKPAPVPKVAPAPPPPKPIPLPSLGQSPSEDQAQARATQRMKNVLGGIELPPNAPEFGDIGASPQPKTVPRTSLPRSPKVSPRVSVDPLAPTQLPPETPVKPRTRSDKFQKDIDSLLKNLQVPESPAVPKPLPRRETSKPRVKTRTSLSKSLKTELLDIEKKLEEERKRREKLKPPVEPQEDVSKPTVTAEVQQAELEQPTTRIQAKGGSSLADKYLSRVQQLIDRQWLAPPVDLVRTMSVVVKFRLHRSGAVSDVVVEETSGNEYYDLAGRRAVLSADPLPPFPRRMSEAYLDTHITFLVGEQIG